MKTKSKVIFYIALALSLVLIDATLKYIVTAYSIDYLPLLHTPFGIDLSLDYVSNTGGAWGMLSSFFFPLLLFRIFMVISLIVYLAKFNKNPKLTIPLGLIATGAFGNILDCFVYGHVVDMIHFTFWHHSYGIFNLADAYISLGCLAMVIILLGKKEASEKPGHENE